MHHTERTLYELYQEAHPFARAEDPLPTYDEFQEIIHDYLNNLSPKKRDKALVDHARYRLIQEVLKNPRNTSISTAQFRFWVKKMFHIQQNIVIHDNKPVAMKEQIYGILVKAHKDAHHGGRDKTSAIVRNQFSWIPKELVARFVRQCPTCISRRNGNQPLSAYSSPRVGYSRTTYSESDMSSPPSAEINRGPNLFESSNFYQLVQQQDDFYRKECYPNYYVSCNQPVHNSEFGLEDPLSRQDILSHHSEL